MAEDLSDLTGAIVRRGFNTFVDGKAAYVKAGTFLEADFIRAMPFHNRRSMVGSGQLDLRYGSPGERGAQLEKENAQLRARVKQLEKARKPRTK